jgi:hypothetical protein
LKRLEKRERNRPSCVDFKKKKKLPLEKLHVLPPVRKAFSKYMTKSQPKRRSSVMKKKDSPKS